jgi:hypothetical protein
MPVLLSYITSKRHMFLQKNETFVASTYVSICTTSPTTSLRDPSSKCTPTVSSLPVVFHTADQNFVEIGYTLKTSLYLSLSV